MHPIDPHPIDPHHSIQLRSSFGPSVVFEGRRPKGCSCREAFYCDAICQKQILDLLGLSKTAREMIVRSTVSPLAGLSPKRKRNQPQPALLTPIDRFWLVRNGGIVRQGPGSTAVSATTEAGSAITGAASGAGACIGHPLKCPGVAALSMAICSHQGEWKLNPRRMEAESTPSRRTSCGNSRGIVCHDPEGGTAVSAEREDICTEMKGSLY